MKLTQKNIELILLLVIVAIAAGVYKFGYLYYSDKTAAVKSETRALQSQIDAFNGKDDDRTLSIEGIFSAQEKKEAVLAKYGPGNTPEKTLAIMCQFEEKLPITIPTLNFGTDTEFFRSETLNDNGEPRTVAYYQDISFTFTTDYQGLKDFMDYINNYPERMNVQNFTINYGTEEDSNTIQGSMNLRLYSVKDDNHEYVAPVFNGIEVGKDNIFE